MNHRRKICNYDSSLLFKTNHAKPAMRNVRFPFIVSPPLPCKTTHPSIFPCIPLGKSASCKRKNHYWEQRRQQQVAGLPWRAILFNRVSRRITGRVKLLLLQTRVTNKRHPGMRDEIDSINTSNCRVYLAPHT